jgi:hypothetical protein
MPLFIQLFMHSPLSIVRLPSRHPSHDIVRRAPEKMRSGSADIAGIERMSTAILDRRGASLLLFLSEPPSKRGTVDSDWSFCSESFILVEVTHRWADDIQLSSKQVILVERL